MSPKKRYFSDLHLPRTTESLNSLVVGGAALLLGLLQEHVFDFYGATLLGNANIAHFVPFVNAFPFSFSQGGTKENEGIAD